MILCQLSASNIQLNEAQEVILTWTGEKNHHYTKPEYIKILKDARYELCYEIKWKSLSSTTQPLQVTVYKVCKEYTMVPLQHNVTVCVGNPITLRKEMKTDLKSAERVCIGVKNFSMSQLLIMDGKFSLKGDF